MTKPPVMLYIDRYGFEMWVNNEKIRMALKNKCSSPKVIRQALAGLAEEAHLAADS